MKETEEIRLRFLELRKETDNLSKENQILAADVRRIVVFLEMIKFFV